MRRLIRARRGGAWFAVADTTALIVFVLLGLRGHGIGSAEGFLRNAGPLLGAWFVVAWAVGTYRRGSWRTLLTTWIVAVPTGLLVRTLLVGSPRGARILVFVAVGLAFTLLLLVLARLLARMLRRAT